MEIELLVIPDCPGAEEAAELLRTALEDIGLGDAQFTIQVIDTEAAARVRRFAGSPAFVVDGADLFDSGTTGGGMACRVYATPEGHRNVPSLRDLRKALKMHAGQAARS